MCKFVNLIINRQNLIFKNTKYLPNVTFLYSRYKKFLNDDYAPPQVYNYVLDLIESTSPLFFIILNAKTEEFAGFVYLDNLTGNSKHIHGAEVSACFEQKYWGDFTKKSALLFFNYCFNELKLKKIKAQIYPFNHRVKTLLRYTGFQLDGTLRAETLKSGNLTNLEVYSLTKKDLRFIKID